jgi:hypothetical protein
MLPKEERADEQMMTAKKKELAREPNTNASIPQIAVTVCGV